MKILISLIVEIEIILNHKIKIKNKNNKILITALSRIHEIFNDENHVTFNHLLDEIQIDQNLVFSTANMIIAEKIISVTNMIFQIIQLETVNLHSTLTEHL